MDRLDIFTETKMMMALSQKTSNRPRIGGGDVDVDWGDLNSNGGGDITRTFPFLFLREVF